MRIGGRRLSQDQVAQILILAEKGEPKKAIARRFHIDHSTVFYHIKRHSGKPLIKVDLTGLPPAPPPLNDADDCFCNNERPKDYQDYIRTEEDRKLELQTLCKHRGELMITIRCRGCGKIVEI